MHFENVFTCMKYLWRSYICSHIPPAQEHSRSERLVEVKEQLHVRRGIGCQKEHRFVKYIPADAGKFCVGRKTYKARKKDQESRILPFNHSILRPTLCFLHMWEAVTSLRECPQSENSKKKNSTVGNIFSFFMFLFIFSFIFISWRLITLQYCSDFCHTLT